MNMEQNIKEIRHVLIYTMVLNLTVSLFKIIYGMITHSVSIYSDGFHSGFDGLSNVIGLVGLRFAYNPPDRGHPYGHRKVEILLTVFIALMMFLACLEIFKNVYRAFIERPELNISPGSFILMLSTLGVNMFVSTYEKRMGKKLNSDFLIADATHTKSDIYVTSGVLIALALSKLGLDYADPIVGAIVGVLVAWSGVEILKSTISVLIDANQIDTKLLYEIVNNIDGVAGSHKIRTRGAKGYVFVDLHIFVEPTLTVAQGHEIAHKVVYAIKTKMDGVADVVVHVEPG
ncbi:cation efflux system protein [Candidatus Magnetobacterium bavaricum]|uniref:Cation efflux system protein n=1 Tax=Candidatus Magnetobacterium bavaricum TaxID=29290 RepID=A0A0F3GUA2_9BACT|nr:cation efflux system protein [Candidatus Magnetobacterium bavaricum]